MYLNFNILVMFLILKILIFKYLAFLIILHVLIKKIRTRIKIQIKVEILNKVLDHFSHSNVQGALYHMMVLPNSLKFLLSLLYLSIMIFLFTLLFLFDEVAPSEIKTFPWLLLRILITLYFWQCGLIFFFF